MICVVFLRSTAFYTGKAPGTYPKIIGYVLSKDYWGRGLMPEAVNRVIRFCFENEKYDYLMCSHFVVNHQSKRVIEKSGFRFVKENIRIAQNGEEHISLYYMLDNPDKGNEIGRGDTGYESMYKEDCGNTCGADSLVVLSHARRIRFLRNLFCGKLWSS